MQGGRVGLVGGLGEEAEVAVEGGGGEEGGVVPEADARRPLLHHHQLLPLLALVHPASPIHFAFQHSSTNHLLKFNRANCAICSCAPHAGSSVGC